MSSEPELWEIVSDPMYRQLGLLVMDGSGSMLMPCRDGDREISKAHAVELAAHSLLKRLRESTNSANFWLAAIAFDTSAYLRLLPTPVLDVPVDTNFNPLEYVWGGGTQLESGLNEAERIVREFFLSPDADEDDECVVILMSDGQDRGGISGDIHAAAPEARSAAEAIKSIDGVKLCATYFDTNGQNDPLARQLLEDLASPGCYKDTHDAEQLRDFFFTSLTTNGSPWSE